MSPLSLSEKLELCQQGMSMCFLKDEALEILDMTRSQWNLQSKRGVGLEMFVWEDGSLALKIGGTYYYPYRLLQDWHRVIVVGLKDASPEKIQELIKEASR